MTQESNRWLQTRSGSGDAYDATYERRAAEGENVHGEADFIESLGVASVLDAGCGTGRVGRELARRGMDVVGVDIDPGMLAVARRTAPGITCHLADLATVQLARSFDAIVMAGNVMIFLAPGSERAVVENMARHLREDGLLVAGFQISAGRLSLRRYDEMAANAGLTLSERWSTWHKDEWNDGHAYAVSVHRWGVCADAGTPSSLP